jgi:hypothetical protein
MQKWVKGKGWGWVWGPKDEVGNLNEMTDATRLAALKLVTQGKAYDLGLPYDRSSYKWPGHSPGDHEFPLTPWRQKPKRPAIYDA